MKRLSVTPIQELYTAPGEENRIFMKRDDLLPFSFGGNKVRIAEAFYRDMTDSGCNALIMYGDRRSNLCRVLSALCEAEGIPSVMIATSEHADGGICFNEQLIRRGSTEVMECPKTGIAETVDRAFAELKSRGFVPYYIYGDRFGRGNEGTAAQAYISAYGEICRQEKELGLKFDLIAAACGTGSTLGGLIAGSILEGDEREIWGISISSRTRERALEILGTTVEEGLVKAGGMRQEIPARCELLTDYTCGGYGLYDREVTEAAESMLKMNSIPFDPVYTAKAWLGMRKELRKREIRGKNILFLHTGGLPLFFDSLNSSRFGA